MFFIGFLGKIFQISWSFLRFSGAVIFCIRQFLKTDYLIPSPNIFLIGKGQNFMDRLFLNQRFLITYSSLIFLCMGCLAQQLKIDRKYNTYFFLMYTKLQQNLCMHGYVRLVLNQRFLITYSLLLLCVGCLTQQLKINRK